MSYWFAPTGGLLTTIAKDSNALGLASAIEVIGVFADKSTIGAEDIAALSKSIVEKGLKLRRTEKVQLTLLKLMECDVPDPVVEHLTKNFGNRVKKIPMLCATCLTEAFVQFGMGALKSSFPIIRDSVSQLFKSSDAATRQAAVQLCAEIQRWTPGILHTTLEKHLREAQIKEVTEATEAKVAEGKPRMPTVGLRRDQEKLRQAKDGSTATATAEFNGDDMLEDLDLGKALRKTEYAAFKKSKVSV